MRVIPARSMGMSTIAGKAHEIHTGWPERIATWAIWTHENVPAVMAERVSNARTTDVTRGIRSKSIDTPNSAKGGVTATPIEIGSNRALRALATVLTNTPAIRTIHAQRRADRSIFCLVVKFVDMLHTPLFVRNELIRPSLGHMIH